MPGWLAQAGQALLDLLYPPRCAGCGRVGDPFCPTCRGRLIPIGRAVCRRCGRPGMSEGELCPTCRHTPTGLDGIVSTAVFQAPLRDAIHKFKYGSVRGLAAPLAACMVETWRSAPLPADVIAPVPLHPARQAARGYNQSALLAAQLSGAVSVPCEPALLARQRATQPQVHLGRAERRANVQGAFTCTRDVTGLAVVLVDDVCTTGATLEACAQALRARGATSVWGFTLSRARWDPAGPLPDQV
jgi:ComF family protein